MMRISVSRLVRAWTPALQMRNAGVPARFGRPERSGENRINALAARLGVALVVRPIRAGDEAAFPDPTEPLLRRRASGAARLAARDALASLGGSAEAPLPRSPGRFPVWPAGFVGSLAHDETLAVAACARAADFAALGVDVEPAAPLPEDIAEIALFGPELRDPAWGRAIFCAKEAVYKAINPLDGSPLEYEDIAVDLLRGQARLRDGRTLRLEWSAGERFIVAAWLGRGKTCARRS